MCGEWTSTSIITDGNYFVSYIRKADEISSQIRSSAALTYARYPFRRYLMQWVVQALCGWFRKFVIWAGSPLPFVGPGYRFTGKRVMQMTLVVSVIR